MSLDKRRDEKQWGGKRKTCLSNYVETIYAILRVRKFDNTVIKTGGRKMEKENRRRELIELDYECARILKGTVATRMRSSCISVMRLSNNRAGQYRIHGYDIANWDEV